MDAEKSGGYYAKCARTIPKTPIHPLTGLAHSDPERTDALYCESERDFGKCGHEGKHFEHKDSTPLPVQPGALGSGDAPTG